MKKILSLIYISALSIGSAYSQTPILHLDAAIDFFPGVVSPTTPTVLTTPARWLDQSGNGNHVQSPLLVAEAPTAATFIAAKGWAGTHFPAVLFHPHPGGLGSYLESAVIPALSTTNNNVTIFIVATKSYDNGHDPTYISIADQGTFNQGMSILKSDTRHSTSTSAYSYVAPACVPDFERPVVIASTFGVSPTNMSRYENGLPVTTATNSGASNYTSGALRTVLLGQRRTASGIFSVAHALAGHVFEVIVYNSILTPTQIQQISNDLRCKYEIFYDNCNKKPLPWPCAKGSNNGGCIDTPSFVLNFLGLDANDDCEVEIDFRGTAVPGATFAGYELSIPGQTPMFLPPTTTFPYQFTVGTPLQRGLLTFSVTGFDNGAPAGTSPCCNFTMSQEIMCVGHVPNPWIGFKPSTISKVENTGDVKIFPNPASTIVYIELNKATLHTISITDMSGKEVKRLQTNELYNQLSVKELASGMYLIQVLNENNESVKRLKFVVQHQ